MIFQSLVMIFTRFFDFEKTISKSLGNLRQRFVAMNMNKCAKFHKDAVILEIFVSD